MAPTTKFCANEELFTTPAPLMSMIANSDEVLIAKGLASDWKTMLSRVMPLVTEIFVCVELEKVATSDEPFGTVAGVQLAGIFQFPVAGFCCQVALPARMSGTLAQNKAVSPRRQK
jgi:hypothetical protein